MKLILLLNSVLLICACTNAGKSYSAPNIHAEQASRDVTYLCKLVKQKYAYYAFHAQIWERACRKAGREAKQVKTALQKLELFERLMDALYDAHASLGINSQYSPRVIPSGSDMWLSMKGNIVRIDALRSFGGAAKAGLEVGDIILRINGKTPIEMMKARLHGNVDIVPESGKVWALNAVAAGNRGAPRYFEVERDGQVLKFDLGNPEPDMPEPVLESRLISPSIGYIRFNNSLGNTGTVSVFDEAVSRLRGAKAWILDLRNTPSGGNTAVAEPVMGRFISKAKEYQIVVARGKEPYNRIVYSRKPVLSGPMMVLVGHWTGSMGEGMAIGLDGMKRARIVGSKMAGLAGGTEEFILPATKFPVRFPTYDLRHLDGTPRNIWEPPLVLEPIAGDSADVVLDFVVKRLSKEISTNK